MSLGDFVRPTLDFLLARDGWVCGLCRGPILDRSDATRDHLVPRYRKGPRDAFWNVVAAHAACNKAKGHKAPAPDQIRWDLMQPEDVAEARHVIGRAAWEWRDVPFGVQAFLSGMTDEPPRIGESI